MQERVPDDSQRAVIDIAKGRHLVLAPPGCGKTYILAERVIHARQHGVEYADMLCLTFTNRASRGMRDRISERTNNPVPADLFVGNVHRFCSNYLFDQKKIPQNSAVIDDLDSESIIAYLAGMAPNADHSRFAGDIVNLQHALSQKEAGMPQQLIVHADVLASSDARRVQLARRYAEYKETDNLLDFEDLLEKTYLYAREDVSHHRYRWIQVDEVQDLSFLQLAIIDLFATDDATIVYLGDSQQAIFSFVGAKLEALENLRQRCMPNIHHLEKNHRSPKYLLDVFNTYAVQQLGISPTLLPITDDDQRAAPQDLCLFQSCYQDFDRLYQKESMRCLSDNSYCSRCEKYHANEYRMAVRLARRYADMEPEGRVALVVSTNADAERLSKEFGDTPHFKISGRDLFSTPTVQLLFSHLNVVANETCFIAWARLLFHLHVLADYSAARNLMRELRGCAISPTDLLIYDDSTYLQQFAQVLDTEEVVLFDTETTGLDVFHDDIIQIAAVKVRQGRLVEGSEFEVIIETNKEIPALVGGHDNPMLSVYLNSPRTDRVEALRQFLDYCGDCVLIGHNVEFDYHILDYNLRRTFCRPLPPRPRFDTLKLARLVEPRLRAYKLERLLTTLHLEGINSHNAIDDVKATLSLLLYCRSKADRFIPYQRVLLAKPEMRNIAVRFRDTYSQYYLHSYERMYELPSHTPSQPVMVDELQYVYLHLLAQGRVEPVDKWEHIVHYLSEDIVNVSVYPSLRQQLDKYLVELNTVRESDLCDSSSMRRLAKERFFIATVHKAKGLEFETVIVFHAVAGSYPFFFNIQNNDQEHIQEDARRFYVALSRAKKHLCITVPVTDNRNVPSQVTPFLKPILDHLAVYAFDVESGTLQRQA